MSHPVQVAMNISIHALREEGDVPLLLPGPSRNPFLSTPSARRATDIGDPNWDIIYISIHALREEGDRWRVQGRCTFPIFLSTPSARRATYIYAADVVQ